MEVIHGDCLEILPTLAADSVDSVVTDPPYGLEFMGRQWDHCVPGIPFWQEVLRVLKPGGYMLAMGGTRTCHRLACAVEDAGFEIRDCIMWLYGSGFPKAKSCLKPAYEPILLCRKPGPKVLPLGVDACRVPGVPPSVPQPQFNSPTGRTYGMQTGEGRNGEMSHAAGRWPANVVHDGSDEVMEAFAAFGERKVSAHGPGVKAKGMFGVTAGEVAGYGDTGTAARFFYCAKASRAERGEGNTHPTVKPLKLMEWLVKLVTQPGGLVLDPFAGSGTTGLAAIKCGLQFIGIEKDSQYVEIARNRLGRDERWELEST